MYFNLILAVWKGVFAVRFKSANSLNYPNLDILKCKICVGSEIKKVNQVIMFAYNFQSAISCCFEYSTFWQEGRNILFDRMYWISEHFNYQHKYDTSPWDRFVSLWFEWHGWVACHQWLNPMYPKKCVQTSIIWHRVNPIKIRS